MRAFCVSHSTDTSYQGLTIWPNLVVSNSDKWPVSDCFYYISTRIQSPSHGICRTAIARTVVYAKFVFVSAQPNILRACMQTRYGVAGSIFVGFVLHFGNPPHDATDQDLVQGTENAHAEGMRSYSFLRLLLSSTCNGFVSQKALLRLCRSSSLGPSTCKVLLPTPFASPGQQLKSRLGHCWWPQLQVPSQPAACSSSSPVQICAQKTVLHEECW